MARPEPEVKMLFIGDRKGIVSLRKEELEVKARLERQLAEAPDLHPFIWRVDVFCHCSDPMTAQSRVVFRYGIWPCKMEDSKDDCGNNSRRVPLSEINFDAEKWRNYFHLQLLTTDLIGESITRALFPLAVATFISDEDMQSIIEDLNYRVLSTFCRRWSFSISVARRE
jgi:hypothetical protein